MCVCGLLGDILHMQMRACLNLCVHVQYEKQELHMINTKLVDYNCMEISFRSTWNFKKVCPAFLAPSCQTQLLEHSLYYLLLSDTTLCSVSALHVVRGDTKSRIQSGPS